MYLISIINFNVNQRDISFKSGEYNNNNCLVMADECYP